MIEKSITVIENQLQYLENHWSAGANLQMIMVLGMLTLAILCIAGAVWCFKESTRYPDNKEQREKMESISVIFTLLSVLTCILLTIDYWVYVNIVGAGKFYFIIKLLR